MVPTVSTRERTYGMWGRSIALCLSLSLPVQALAGLHLSPGACALKVTPSEARLHWQAPSGRRGFRAHASGTATSLAIERTTRHVRARYPALPTMRPQVVIIRTANKQLSEERYQLTRKETDHRGDAAPADARDHNALVAEEGNLRDLSHRRFLLSTT